MSPWVIALAIFILAGTVWLILIRTMGWSVVPGRPREGGRGGGRSTGQSGDRPGGDARRS